MAALSTIALAGGAVLAAGGQVAGSVIQKNAAQDAAEQAAITGQRAQEISQEQFGIGEEILKGRMEMGREELLRRGAQAEELIKGARAEFQPLKEAQLQGVEGLRQLAAPGSELETAQRKASTQAIQRQLAAQGLLRSKKQVDLLTGLELGLGQQRAGILSGLAGMGGIEKTAGATMNLAALQSGLGSSLAESQFSEGSQRASLRGQRGASAAAALTSQGQIAAQSAMARGQAISGGLAGLGNIIQSTAGGLLTQQQNQQQTNLLKQLLAGQGGAVGGRSQLTNLGSAPFGTVT